MQTVCLKNSDHLVYFAVKRQNISTRNRVNGKNITAFETEWRLGFLKERELKKKIKILEDWLENGARIKIILSGIEWGEGVIWNIVRSRREGSRKVWLRLALAE